MVCPIGGKSLSPISHLPSVVSFFSSFQSRTLIPYPLCPPYLSLPQSLKNSSIPNLYRANPILLDVGLAISMASALLANLALISRFLDRRVARWTLVAIVALAVHDAINVTAIIVFGVVHRFNDGYVVSPQGRSH